MKLIVSRLELTYWFWTYGNSTNSGRNQYMSVMRGYYNPKTRMLYAGTCATARLAGTKWVSMDLGATRTRRTLERMRKVMMESAKHTVLWSYYNDSRIEELPDHYVLPGSVVSARELGLCDSE